MKQQVPRASMLTLATVLRELGAAQGPVTVSDKKLMELTGYSKRSVEFSFEKLVNAGALTWERPSAGVRTICIAPKHSVWVLSQIVGEAIV